MERCHALTLLNVTMFPQDDAVDVFPLAFMNVFFGTGGVPSLNLANVNQILSPFRYNLTAMGRPAILPIMQRSLEPPFLTVLHLLLI